MINFQLNMKSSFPTISSIKEPNVYLEAIQDNRWKDVMKKEIEAL